MRDSTFSRIIKFRDDRNWKQFHNPRDLAMSISIESAELLENFQWDPTAEQIASRKQAIADELADVLIYAAYLADVLELDIDEIINTKIDKNTKKYSIDKSFGSSEKQICTEDNKR